MDDSKAPAPAATTTPSTSEAAFHRMRANQLFKRANELLAMEDVAAAMPLLHACLEFNPGHYQAARVVAAIAMKNGAAAQGRAILTDFFKDHPIRTKRRKLLGKAPALLSIRGFSGCQVIPWRNEDGSLTTVFRGGHFTTRFLIAKPDFPEHVYTIAEDNILTPGALPDHAVMLNKIADPDVELESLITLQRYLAQQPETPVLNRPDKVLLTTRDANYQRLKHRKGITFPETHRVNFDAADADEVAATFRRLGLDDGPVILRATGTHTARTTALIRTTDDIAAYVGNSPLSGPHYLIRYIEWLWNDAYFRKLRLFCIDGVFYPTVCHIDQVWNVHGGNRKEIMRDNEVLMAEEKRFLLDWKSYVGTANADALEGLIDLVGLEFFGIDFNVGPEGVLIYEMNPAMRHSFDHAQNFPYKMPFDLAITQAFTKMITGRLGGE